MWQSGPNQEEDCKAKERSEGKGQKQGLDSQEKRKNEIARKEGKDRFEVFWKEKRIIKIN